MRERRGVLRRFARVLPLALVALGGLAIDLSGPPSGYAQSEIKRGSQVFAENCAVCHGPRGDGDGRVADQFRRRPLSFRIAKFKFRSTQSGSLPLDEDLFRTISRGVARTGMLPYGHLDEADRRAVIAYVKTFSPRFQSEPPRPPAVIPPAPNPTPELIAQGRSAYTAAGCADCHGERGKGDGPSAPTLKDDWGQQFVPSDLNLTRLPRRSGPAPVDLYRSIATGLDGTPMPSYGGTLTPEQIWAIVAYLLALPAEIEWSGLPEGEGAELVRWRCTVCHHLDGPNLPRQDLSGWTQTVELMIRWGAPIRPKEREVIIRYLAEHFGVARAQ